MEDEQKAPETPENPAPGPGKRFRDMDITERRKYLRESKQRSRERQRAEQAANETVRWQDYELPAHQRQLLDRHSENITSQIQSELPDKLSTEDMRMIDMAASIVYAAEQKWGPQRVQLRDGFGTMVAGYFPDSAASEIAQYHRFSDLSQSDSFTRLYTQFLKLSNKWTQT